MGQVLGNIHDDPNKPVQSDAQYNAQGAANLGLSALSKWLQQRSQQPMPQGQQSPILPQQSPQLPDNFWKSIMGGQ